MKNIDAFVFDVDGTLFEGGSPRKGAVEFISLLNAHNFPYAILTNNTTRTIKETVRKFSEMGFEIPAASILTAAKIVARVLVAESVSGKRCLVIGEDGLLEAIAEAGFEITRSDHENVDYVVIGMDRQLTYEKLKAACLAIRQGAKFVSSNADPVFPDGNDLIPASGAIQAALETATAQKARVTGKPRPTSFNTAIQMLGSKPSKTAMIGDQLEIDIRGAKRVGMQAFLVLSSVTPGYSISDSDIVPDGVFKDMEELYRKWLRR